MYAVELKNFSCICDIVVYFCAADQCNEQNTDALFEQYCNDAKMLKRVGYMFELKQLGNTLLRQQLIMQINYHRLQGQCGDITTQSAILSVKPWSDVKPTYPHFSLHN